MRPDGADGDDPAQNDAARSGAPAVLRILHGRPGPLSLASMQDEWATLELIRQIAPPADLFHRASTRDLGRDAVMEKDAAGLGRVSRVTYEILGSNRCASDCVLRKLMGVRRQLLPQFRRRPASRLRWEPE